ncbi:glutamate receptor ionotropic, kainate 2 [Teleopsis dalmanni]|uniref:glutamate receptor ionotropic, kainate 2 n=1 Tax=Teleopsis dalmanni TaxID=139649 RepID=UPI0018CDEDF5|nr:glutamate receptor ionotropic, kainate 2 [Teleopsis dalmanni]
MFLSRLLRFLLPLLLPLVVSGRELQPIKIGAIFFENETDIARAFEAAVERVNSAADTTFRLLPLVRQLGENTASTALQRAACDMVDNGVTAIFGPSSKAKNDIVAVICNATGILHIQFDMAFEETVEEKENHQMTVNVYPSQLVLSKAYADIIQSLGWRKFTVVYNEEDVHAPTRLQDLLQLHDLHNDVVRVRKYKRDEDFRILWKSIKGERRIVLDCEPDKLVDLLNASIPFDLTGEFNQLFLTNLEVHNSNWEDLRDNVSFAVNVTAARLLLTTETSDASYLQDTVTDDTSMEQPPDTLLTNLIDDAVSVFVMAIRNMSRSYMWPIEMPSTSCASTQFENSGTEGFGEEFENSQTRSFGEVLVSTMKKISGVNNTDFRTSDLQFDEDGLRFSFNIEVYEPILNYGMLIWNSRGHITLLHVDEGVSKKIVYRIATRIGEPYFMIDEEAAAANATGNKRYKGYAVDLIEALANEMKFEYLFVPVVDNAYGKYNKDTKQWNGIIGELINNDAHMGICDLTVTQARKTVVDFTVPFMQLGISILAYNIPQEQKHVLAFLDPFAVEVWLYVMTAILIISFMFVFVARVAKAEWENPHPCDREPDALENQWHIANTFWLTMASVMCAGSDILPKSPSMRTLTGFWWVFAIIVSNSYTANLAAFLTNSQMQGTISDIKSLASQTSTKFGTMEGGSTYTFFSESNETTYRLAFNIMNGDDPSAYTKSNEEGVERVKKMEGKYMFLMETTSLEYNIAQNSSLRMVGEKFGEKHYAIAVPYGAEYRSMLSVGILRLSERGELFKIKNNWWKPNENQTTDSKESTGETPDMNFEEVRGIFYTLGIGLFIAYLVGVIEFLIHTQKVAADEKLSFKKAFIKEVKFVLCIWNNKKPISCTPTASLGSMVSVKTPKLTPKNTPEESMEELQDLQNMTGANTSSRKKENSAYSHGGNNIASSNVTENVSNV